MNRIRKTIVGVSVLGASLSGATIGAMSIGTASAATDTSTSVATASASSDTAASNTSTAQSSAAQPARQRGSADPSKGGHVANGITETVLTGDDATKATAAANAAVPGANIDRVETDAEGAAFEAHMTKADGSRVTVKLNADFTVKSIDNGMS